MRVREEGGGGKRLECCDGQFKDLFFASRQRR